MFVYLNWYLCQGQNKKEIKQLEDDSYIELESSFLSSTDSDNCFDF